MNHWFLFTVTSKSCWYTINLKEKWSFHIVFVCKYSGFHYSCRYMGIPFAQLLRPTGWLSKSVGFDVALVIYSC